LPSLQRSSSSSLWARTIIRLVHIISRVGPSRRQSTPTDEAEWRAKPFIYRLVRRALRITTAFYADSHNNPPSFSQSPSTGLWTLPGPWLRRLYDATLSHPPTSAPSVPPLAPQ
jgi:hypothetical protein